MKREISFSRRTMLRASALVPAAALGGCSVFDNLFIDTKAKLPGKREPVAMSAGDALAPDPRLRNSVALPAPAATNWPQAGGNAAHVTGHGTGGGLAVRWTAAIGEGGGYREKITAQPIVAGGRVFTMDSDGMVSAFDAKTGAMAWTRETQAKKDRSANVGGGIAWADGAVFASTGRAELLRINGADGEIAWRKPLGSPARSAPTVAGGTVFLTTLDERLVARSAGDGAERWQYQAQNTDNTMLGAPAPAVAEGMVVAGFGSGALVALRADTGSVAWTDSLGSARGTSVIDLSSIRGLPVIDRGRVYVTGLGGLTVSIDLRSGRRLWELDLASGDTLWLAGNTLFVIDVDQQLVALDADDGRVRWLSHLPRFKDPDASTGPIFWRGPILVGGKLLMAGTTSALFAANANTGEFITSVDLPDTASITPVSANGVVYVVTDDGTLTAFA